MPSLLMRRVQDLSCLKAIPPACVCYPLICIYYRKVRLVGKILFTNIDEGTTNPGVKCIYQRVKSVIKKMQVFGVIFHPNFNELQSLNLAPSAVIEKVYKTRQYDGACRLGRIKIKRCGGEVFFPRVGRLSQRPLVYLTSLSQLFLCPSR